MPGLSDILRELKDVKAGDDVADVASSTRINAIQEAIRCLVRGDNINTGPNVLKKTQAGFVTLSGQPSGRRGGGRPIDLAFAFTPTSIVNEANETVNGVLIRDGKINGEFPSGMGFGDYILWMSTSYMDIWAGITFDTDTLEITSRWLDSGTFPTVPVPEEEFGTTYFYLGFAYVEDGQTSHVLNTYAGDINFELIYGAFNSMPALLCVQTFSPWMPVPDALLVGD
jgi:hypothetical protein